MDAIRSHFRFIYRRYSRYSLQKIFFYVLRLRIKIISRLVLNCLKYHVPNVSQKKKFQDNGNLRKAFYIPLRLSSMISLLKLTFSQGWNDQLIKINDLNREFD